MGTPLSPTHTYTANTGLLGFQYAAQARHASSQSPPGMWLAFRALRAKSLTTSAVPHIQEPWIRASEAASLTSTSQSFQSTPLHTFSFFMRAPRLFSLFNWLQKLKLMICLSGHIIIWRVWPPSVLIFEKLSLLLSSSVMDHTYHTEEIIPD